MECHLTKSDESRATLLIVDDEPAILRMLTEAFDGSEFNVIASARGDKAIEIYRSKPDEIDLILLDVQMHPTNGMQLLSELRKINPLVRVAFMSGSPIQKPIVEKQDFGGVPVISKPFYSLRELVDELRKLLA